MKNMWNSRNDFYPDNRKAKMMYFIASIIFITLLVLGLPNLVYKLRHQEPTMIYKEELAVLDKYTEVKNVLVAGSFAPVTTYYVVVKVNDQKYNVECESVQYDNLDIGESTFFHIYQFDDGKISKILIEENTVNMPKIPVMKQRDFVYRL